MCLHGFKGWCYCCKLVPSADVCVHSSPTYHALAYACAVIICRVTLWWRKSGVRNYTRQFILILWRHVTDLRVFFYTSSPPFYPLIPHTAYVMSCALRTLLCGTISCLRTYKWTKGQRILWGFRIRIFMLCPFVPLPFNHVFWKSRSWLWNSNINVRPLPSSLSQWNNRKTHTSYVPLSDFHKD